MRGAIVAWATVNRTLLELLMPSLAAHRSLRSEDVQNARDEFLRPLGRGSQLDF